MKAKNDGETGQNELVWRKLVLRATIKGSGMRIALVRHGPPKQWKVGMADTLRESSAPAEQPKIELRDPRLAAFLAWLVPGLGHVYQRRTGKGLLFMICILGTFFYGMYLGSGRVVYASTTNPIDNFSEFKDRWQYGCQLGVGLAALPAYVQTWRVESGDPPLFSDDSFFYRPPYTLDSYLNVHGNEPDAREQFRKLVEGSEHNGTADPNDPNRNHVLHATERERWHHDLNFEWDIATMFTTVAGLLNVLAICDAYGGPLAPPTKPETDNEKENEKKSPDG